MGSACGTHEVRNAYRNIVGSLKGRNQLGDLGVDGTLTGCEDVCIVLNWLRVVFIGVILCT